MRPQELIRIMKEKVGKAICPFCHVEREILEYELHNNESGWISYSCGHREKVMPIWMEKIKQSAGKET